MATIANACSYFFRLVLSLIPWFCNSLKYYFVVSQKGKLFEFLLVICFALLSTGSICIISTFWNIVMFTWGLYNELCWCSMCSLPINTPKFFPWSVCMDMGLLCPSTSPVLHSPKLFPRATYNHCGLHTFSVVRQTFFFL